MSPSCCGLRHRMGARPAPGGGRAHSHSFRSLLGWRAGVEGFVLARRCCQPGPLGAAPLASFARQPRCAARAGPAPRLPVFHTVCTACLSACAAAGGKALERQLPDMTWWESVAQVRWGSVAGPGGRCCVSDRRLCVLVLTTYPSAPALTWPNPAAHGRKLNTRI